MGRCYEFGVEIHPGCENTMVVSPAGGACECAACGASCPGRFAGCAAVVAVPGRVPPSSPAWARPGAERPDPPAAAAGRLTAGPRRPSQAARPAPAQAQVATVDAPLPVAAATNGHRPSGAVPDLAAVQASLVEVKEILWVLTERAAEDPADPADPFVEAIEALTTKLLDRDERIAGAFVTLGDRQVELNTQVDRLTAAVEALAVEVLAVVAAGAEKAAALPPSLRQLLTRRGI